MSGFNYVVEISLSVYDANWNSYKRDAANWLHKNVGESEVDWDNMDVPITSPVTLGFASASKKRMFILWSEMQGVRCNEPETIEIIASEGDDLLKIRVND